MSDSARRGLEVAVQSNPDGARLLLAVLRTAPGAVRYKADDRFGPLEMMVRESGQNVQVPARLRRSIRPVLPTEFHEAAENFQSEWLRKSFSKTELADEIEAVLREMKEDIPSRRGGWRIIRQSP